MYNNLRLQNVEFVLDVVKRIAKTETITKYTTSYGLKDWVEKLVKLETNGLVSYITNEELTLAMDKAGFKRRSTHSESPHFHYNLSKSSMDKVFINIL